MENARRWGLDMLDGKTVQQVALELTRTGRLDLASDVVDRMKPAETLSAAGSTQILSGLPASVDIEPLRGAAFVDKLLSRTAFQGGAVCHE